jgi:hypothetical protein
MNKTAHRVWINPKGYACIAVKEGGRTKAFLLHSLEWALANGPVPDGYQIHHLDHDKGNWRLANLMLVDPQTHRQMHRKGRSTDNTHKPGVGQENR